jgi:hypothetical protein
MRWRHSIRSYYQLGATFFSQAAASEASPHKAQLLEMIGTHFETWRQRHARLARELRDQAFLLTGPRWRVSGLQPGRALQVPDGAGVNGGECQARVQNRTDTVAARLSPWGR